MTSNGESHGMMEGRGPFGITLSFYLLLIALAFLHSFITFRGLSSAAGMDQGQIARSLARGDGFSTQFIRPYAWRQMIEAGKEGAPLRMKDTYQPPLQPLLWAPIFKVMGKSSQIDAEGGTRVYALDRAIACMGAAFYLATIGVAYIMMRRLFDGHIAAITVLVLALCEPLWSLAVSGGSRILVMLLFSLAVLGMVQATQHTQDGTSPWRALAGAALCCGLLVMTHWMTVWLVLGIIVWAAVLLPRKAATAGILAAVPLLCLAGWGARNQAACGNMFGASKTTLQSILMMDREETLMRDFEGTNAAVDLDSLMRKAAANVQTQLGDIYFHLGLALPALCFFIGILHRFRHEDASSVRWGVLIAWLMTALGMCMVGLPDKQMDDNDLYCAFVPVMSGFGIAMLAVLWRRFFGPSKLFWPRWGFAVAAVALSSIPMAATLPQDLRLGMFFKGQLINWPPYMPERMARLHGLVGPNETLFSDAPWAMAWYADRATIWMPVARRQFFTMRSQCERSGTTVAGFVLTPISARAGLLHEIFEGSYREWADVVFRGPMIAFQKEVNSRDEFPYKAVYPLVASPVPQTNGLNVVMAYYADKVRWGNETAQGGKQGK